MTAILDTTTQARALLDKLETLGVPSELVDVVTAAQVVRFELRPANEKVKMHDYRRLSRADDLAYALGARRVRIVAPVPGKSVVAVEVDRQDRQQVALDDLPRGHYPLLVPIGQDIDGRPALLPIPDAPHVLVAGQSGAGKSMGLHAILASLLTSHSPQELQLVLVDPKHVEFSAWEGVPHLAAPVADDAETAMTQLRGAILQMEERYRLLRRLGARDVAEGNRFLRGNGYDELPYVLVVADEIAELMMTSSREAEGLIVRLAQKGRAAGIHLILATQYPLREVITGLIRVNVPTRICFAVPDMTASRVVLDQNGAESLLGAGDGLFSFAGLSPVRFQGPLVSRVEVHDIVERWKEAS